MNIKAPKMPQRPMSRGLSDKAKSELREALKVFPKANIDAFLGDVDYLVKIFREFVSKPGDRSLDREEKRGILGRLKNTHDDLDRILSRKYEFSLPNDFAGFFTLESQIIYNFDQDLWDRIAEAYETIGLLIAQIEDHLLKTARRSGQQDRADKSHFFTVVGMVYIHRCNKRPTKDKDGPFYQVALIIWNDLVLSEYKTRKDKKKEEPIRGIASALVTLQRLRHG